MGVRGETLNNDIIVKAVIEVGKFVGVEFNKDNARKFLDCLVAVIGKYLDENPDRAFHLNKYVVSKNNKSLYNLFNVQIYRNDKFIKTPTDIYEYYIKGGNLIYDFRKLMEHFTEKLIEQGEEGEEKSNEIIDKLLKMRKLTKNKKGRREKRKKNK